MPPSDTFLGDLHSFPKLLLGELFLSRLDDAGFLGTAG